MSYLRKWISLSHKDSSSFDLAEKHLMGAPKAVCDHLKENFMEPMAAGDKKRYIFSNSCIANLSYFLIQLFSFLTLLDSKEQIA